MKRIDVYRHNKKFPELDPDDILQRRPWKYSFDWVLQDFTYNTLLGSWPIYTGNGLWHFKLDGLIIEL